MTINEFKDHDAETPDINFLRILFCSLYYLGSHPTHSTNFGISFTSFLSQLSSISKVTYLNISIVVKEYIIRFDISVDNMSRVQVFQSHKHFIDYILNYLFCKNVEETSFKNISQTTSIHVFNENPVAILKEIAVMVSHNIVWITHWHECYLITNRLHRFVCLSTNKFKCVIFLVNFLLYQINFPIPSRTNCFHDVIIVCRVIFLE